MIECCSKKYIKQNYLFHFNNIHDFRKKVIKKLGRGAREIIFIMMFIYKYFLCMKLRRNAIMTSLQIVVRYKIHKNDIQIATLNNKLYLLVRIFSLQLFQQLFTDGRCNQRCIYLLLIKSTVY